MIWKRYVDFVMIFLAGHKCITWVFLNQQNEENTKQQQSCANILTRLHWSSSGQCVAFKTGLFIFSNPKWWSMSGVIHSQREVWCLSGESYRPCRVVWIKPCLHVQLFNVLSPARAKHTVRDEPELSTQYATNRLHVNKRLRIYCRNTGVIRVSQLSPAIHCKHI